MLLAIQNEGDHTVGKEAKMQVVMSHKLDAAVSQTALLIVELGKGIFLTHFNLQTRNNFELPICAYKNVCIF